MAKTYPHVALHVLINRKKNCELKKNNNKKKKKQKKNVQIKIIFKKFLRYEWIFILNFVHMILSINKYSFISVAKIKNKIDLMFCLYYSETYAALSIYLSIYLSILYHNNRRWLKFVSASSNLSTSPSFLSFF